MKLTVIQTLPALHSGGVERGTIEVASELARLGHRAIVISAGGKLVEDLLAAGGEHITLPIGNKSLFTLLLVRKLIDIIESCGANILHSRSRFPAWISFLAWSFMDRHTRPSFITSVHGSYSVSQYSKIMTRGERVIAISDFIQHYIHENYAGVDMSKVVVIPRGISDENFPYNYRPSSSWLKNWEEQNPQIKNSFVITLPARITRWKGQEDFIKVVARLKQTHVDVHSFIVGGLTPGRQSYQKELESLISYMGLKKHITFTGHRNDLRDVMSVSNLVMSLSREPEAFGRTSLEALGIGVPVIAYDHGGASEVLNRIFPQGLVPALDFEAVSKKALEFHGAMPLVPDDKPFSLQRMLDSTLDLYQELGSH